MVYKNIEIHNVGELVENGNVTYINGLSLSGDMSLISADETHPNIYGINQIASRLTDLLKSEGK